MCAKLLVGYDAWGASQGHCNKRMTCSSRGRGRGDRRHAIDSLETWPYNKLKKGYSRHLKSMRSCRAIRRGTEAMRAFCGRTASALWKNATPFGLTHAIMRASQKDLVQLSSLDFLPCPSVALCWSLAGSLRSFAMSRRTWPPSWTHPS